MRLRRRPPEVHVFLLWSEARRQEHRILADIADHFTLLDLVEVVWTVGEPFSRSLTRMYGTALSPGSDKEVHCGSGAFLLAVVEDPRPRYRPRSKNRQFRLYNSAVFDARRRYRRWTGNGHRVHASESATEVAQNLILLLGKRIEDYGGAPPHVGPPRQHVVDPPGTHGWHSVDELVDVLEVYDTHLIGRSTDGSGHILYMRTSDLWWAQQIAGGREVAPQVREVQVGDEAIRLSLEQDAPAD